MNSYCSYIPGETTEVKRHVARALQHLNKGNKKAAKRAYNRAHKKLRQAIRHANLCESTKGQASIRSMLHAAELFERLEQSIEG